MTDTAPQIREENAPDFFARPILNSPYEYPSRHWELDPTGLPTQRVLQHRRKAEFVTPIPKPKKRKAGGKQKDLVLDEGHGLSTEAQRYDPTPIINELRTRVDAWRALENPDQWGVTPETRRLLQHWRHHRRSSSATWSRSLTGFGMRTRYDGTSTGPTAQHLALAHLDDVKVRLGFVNRVGDQKGVDSLIVTDMIALARNRRSAGQ